MLTANRFKEVYKNYTSSGLTVKEYCSNIGIHETTFYYWKKKLKNNLTGQNGFIPLHLKQEPTNELNGFPILAERANIHGHQAESIPPSYEITYPNGVTVKLNGNHNIELLQSLILLNKAGHV